MENICDNDLYKNHLIENLEDKRLSAESQQGTSNLEGENYLKNIKDWYSKLYLAIEEQPPEYFVKELTIYQNVDRDILDVRFLYYPYDSRGGVSLCIIEN